MNKLKLNHTKILQIMEAKNIRVRDLVLKLDESRQFINYMIKKGGPGYAPILAKALECDQAEILTPNTINNVKLPKGLGMFGSQVRTQS
jgi:hypothetical protein